MLLLWKKGTESILIIGCVAFSSQPAGLARQALLVETPHLLQIINSNNFLTVAIVSNFLVLLLCNSLHTNLKLSSSRLPAIALLGNVWLQ